MDCHELRWIVWIGSWLLFLPRFDETNCTSHLIVENVEWLEVLSKDLHGFTSVGFSPWGEERANMPLPVIERPTIRLTFPGNQVVSQHQPTHLETFAYFCDQSRLYAQSTHIETKLQRWHLCTFTLFHPSEQIMFHKFLQCLAVQVKRPRAACRTVRERMPAAAPRTPKAVWAKDLLKAPAICHSRHVDMICRDSWFMCLNMFDWISCILLLMHTHSHTHIYTYITYIYIQILKYINIYIY